MELLIAVVARSSKIDDIQSGEVIAVQPDGWEWTELELSNPNWQIVRSPILSTHASSLLMTHTYSNIRVPGKKYPRKKHLLNLPTLGISSGTDTILSLTNDQMVSATTTVS